MQTVNQLLDTVKAKHQIPSDYKLAMYLGVAQATVQNWRHSRSLPDQKAVERLAVELGLDRDVLLLQVEAQRAANDAAKSAWLRIAQRLQAGAVHLVALVAVALVGIVSSPSAHAVVTSPAAADKVSSVYYVKQRLGQLFRALRRAARTTLGLFKGDLNVSSADADPALFNPA